MLSTWLLQTNETYDRPTALKILFKAVRTEQHNTILDEREWMTNKKIHCRSVNSWLICCLCNAVGPSQYTVKLIQIVYYFFTRCCGDINQITPSQCVLVIIGVLCRLLHWLVYVVQALAISYQCPLRTSCRPSGLAPISSCTAAAQ